MRQDKPVYLPVCAHRWRASAKYGVLMLAAAAALLTTVAVAVTTMPEGGIGSQAEQELDTTTAIVFTDVTTDGVERELFVVRPSGDLRVQLTASEGVTEASPAWSPDRDAIAYSVDLPDDPGHGEGGRGIQVLDVSSRVTQTVSVGPHDSDPDWHPNGDLIAFVSAFGMGTEGQSSAISVVEESGDNPRPLLQLVDPRRLIESPEWSPDGERILFVVSYPGYGGELYISSADGSGATILHPRAAWDDVEPAWSPDGRRIAFATAYNEGRVSAIRHAVAVLDIDSKVVGVVASSSEWDLRHPSWSPDGSEIVFEARASGNLAADELFAIPWHGGDWRGPVTRGAEPDWMGSGQATPSDATPATPTATTAPGSPTATAAATSTRPGAPSAPPPATLPPFPTFGPLPATATRGPLPTFPPPTLAASATPTSGAASEGSLYVPYAAREAVLVSSALSR